MSIITKIKEIFNKDLRIAINESFIASMIILGFLSITFTAFHTVGMIILVVMSIGFLIAATNELFFLTGITAIGVLSMINLTPAFPPVQQLSIGISIATIVVLTILLFVFEQKDIDITLFQNKQVN